MDDILIAANKVADEIARLRSLLARREGQALGWKLMADEFAELIRRNPKAGNHIDQRDAEILLERYEQMGVLR